MLEVALIFAKKTFKEANSTLHQNKCISNKEALDEPSVMKSTNWVQSKQAASIRD
jgi:hypothetical protein